MTVVVRTLCIDEVEKEEALGSATGEDTMIGE